MNIIRFPFDRIRNEKEEKENGAESAVDMARRIRANQMLARSLERAAEHVWDAGLCLEGHIPYNKEATEIFNMIGETYDKLLEAAARINNSLK